MDTMGLLAYFAALMAFTASPGPIVAVLAARSVGNDSRGAVAFATGLCIGEVVVVSAVVAGLGALAQAEPEWFAVARYAGVAYLLWLAVRIWADSSAKGGAARSGGLVASTGAGFALCVGTPSVFLSYILFIPIAAPQGINSIEQSALLVLVTALATVPVYFGIILIARQLKRVTLTPATSSLIGRITATVIGVTAVWILAA